MDEARPEDWVIGEMKRQPLFGKYYCSPCQIIQSDLVTSLLAIEMLNVES